MHRLLLLPIATILSSQVHSACQPGTFEIGDTGPDDSIVCAVLESNYPSSEIQILNREIHAADRVSVAIELDGRAQRVEYRLSDFQWLLGNSGLLARQR